ncbi:melanoma-associated antigen B16 [Peromyscus eremicus]|uniref:melanoma-associated antigen B16 n=1 Tax=Peromyscus eremicus TaxID=42410 RepID=UPI0027DE8AB9|nr:melanoma-associated antigen B16 [Peromyscus eremicus]
MSQRQKNPECAADQGQTCEETRGLQVAAVSSNVEEPCTSSHFMASSLKGQTCEETQSLQVAAVSNDTEEPCSSSHLMASSLKSQTCKETQGLKITTQVSRNVEKPCSSSHSLMASYQNDPADETPSTSGGLQSPSASSRQSDEALSNQQQVQGYPIYPPFQQHTMNVPMMSVDSKVDFLVNYMLYKYQMREIMSMTDILRLIVREDEYRYHEILMRAAERMEMVFGLDVKEVDPVNHCYALFIKLGLTYDGMRSNEYSFPKTGFLILILGVVFMKGNRATEDQIWEVLNPMGIYAGMNHFVFGDPRKLITDEFVKEQYLVYQPVANSNPVQYEYVWGPRARFETSKMKVLEFVAKVQGTDPTAFQSQYEEALIEEEERTLTMILSNAGPRSSSGASSSAMGSSFPHI